MKKFLCIVLALAAVFCFAGCEDGKCDECGAKRDSVKVYETNDGDKELCGLCAVEQGWNDVKDGITGK